MIKKITIHNFRGIRNCEVSDLDQVNVFIGKNSSGKSSILESLQIVTSLMFYPILKISAIISRRSERSWHPQELFYWYNIDEELNISLQFDDNTEIRIFSRHKPNERDPNIIEFYLSGTNFKEPVLLQQFGGEQSGRLEESLRQARLRVIKPSPPGSMRSIDISSNILDFLRNVTLVDPIGKKQMSEMEEEFVNLRFAGKYGETINDLKEIYNESMRSWEIFPYLIRRQENRTAFMYQDGRPVYVDNLGEGVKFAFSALTLAYNRRNTSILWEEIETHQHPSSLRKLIKRLLEISELNNLQLFISTQSPDAIRYFRMYFPKAKLFSLEKDETSNIVYIHDEENLLKLFQDLEWDIENILKYEKIVVFDGIEDEIIIKDFFNKIKGHSIESEGMILLPVRGNGSKLRELIRNLTISSKNFTVIKDLDDKSSRDEVKELISSWISTLKREGFHIEEDENELKLTHTTSGKKSTFKKASILSAGNPERFPRYRKHSITDYLLEILLDQREILSELKPIEEIESVLDGENSKQILTNAFDTYNLELVRAIVGLVDKDKIPESIVKDIINPLSIY